MTHITKLRSKGFTLIELLVVIAIIAIIAIVVVLVLNPAELLKQSRDSDRFSDLATLKTATALYIQDTPGAKLASSTAGYTGCYISTLSGNGTSSARCGVFVSTGITTVVSTTSATYRKTDSTGWVPVNFSQLSYGTPLSSLPVDPTNNATYYYAYAASTTLTFEYDAFLESSKYSNSATNDGGDNTTVFEGGTNLTL